MKEVFQNQWRTDNVPMVFVIVAVKKQDKLEKELG